MAQPMAPRLSTAELLPQMVTEADAFTALRYLRQREQAPAVWELENSGSEKLPGTPAVLADTFQALWSADPSVKPEDKVSADKRYWRGLLEQTMASDVFKQLHATTEGSSLLSFVGTIEAGQTMLGLVPKKDKEKLRELSQAAEQAEDAESEAKEAEAQAEALEQMAQDMLAQANSSSAGSSGQSAGGGQPQGAGQSGVGAGQDQSGQSQAQGGSPSGTANRGQLTAAQAKTLADKLAGQLGQAKAKAQAARAEANAASSKADALADALMGQPGSEEAEQKLRDLKRLGMGALAKAEEKVSKLSDTIECWGLEQGELSRMQIPEAVGLLEKMRKSDAFKKFTALLGRLRAIAAKKAKSKTEGEGQKIARQETGSDLNRAYPAELAAILHPATRIPSLMRWARGELRLRGEETKRPQGHGPVVVCEDSSGSMDGAKQQWAKGVVLATAHFAKLRQRGFGWVMFDSSVRQAKTYPKGRLSAKDLLEIAESRSGGGTDFEAPLRRAIEMIEKEGLKKADILFVTDGDCAVSASFLQWLAETKKRLEFSVITVLCDAGDHISDATVKQFSDRVERVSAFTTEEAETKVFAHL